MEGSIDQQFAVEVRNGTGRVFNSRIFRKQQRKRLLGWNDASLNRLPNEALKRVETSMLYFSKRSLVLWIFPFLILLSGCGSKLECDSPETRSAVLGIVSGDHNNALVAYAAKNSTAANLESVKPLYQLGERMVSTSSSKDKRTLQCSGALSVFVGNTKATKEVNFTVQQAADGKISVSVAPFQF